MTQVFPTSPEIIYNTIVADGTITSLAGEYEFRGGGAAPAISIMTPGRDLPALKSTTGVEIVIHDVADVRRRDQYDTSNIETTWKVFVICWEPATGSEMHSIIYRMMEIFLGSTAVETVATADGLGAMVQSMVLIPSDRPIRV